jgi:hypothetical protein
MAIALYVFLHLVHSRELLLPPTSARVFATVDGAVVKPRGLVRTRVFDFDMAIQRLLLSKAFKAPVCQAFVGFVVDQPVLAT